MPGFWDPQSLASPHTDPQSFVVLQRIRQHWGKKPTKQTKKKRLVQGKCKTVSPLEKKSPVVLKCSWDLMQGSGQGPELLVLVFLSLLVLGKCSRDLVQGSGQSPEPPVLVFHFLLVVGKRSLNWAWGLVQVQGRAQSSWVLFSPCCLSLGKCGSCVMPCFPSRVHARNPLGSLELGQSCAVELCSQAVAFHCSRD